MYTRTPLIALLLSLVFNVAANAQQDTSVVELGRVNLPKTFTQSVKIKATDLEKIPFTNVSDVITTWLYGYYGDKKSYVYVIDGILNTDVNAYSIFDIEEITMVQNAAVYINGALPGQVLLLVKTKKNTSRASGVNFNGQTNLVNLRSSNNSIGGGSTKNFYHQYYVSAYKNTKSVNAGASITFQHNVFPLYKAYTAVGSKPYNSDRFKFNTYFDAKLGASNKLSITAGYVPQSDDVDATQVSFTNQGQVAIATKASPAQNSLYGNVSLVSKIADGFINKLSVGYVTRKTDIGLSQSQTAYYYYNPNDGVTQLSSIDSSGRVNSFLASDDLLYNLRIGKLSLTPGVNLTYKKVTDNGGYHVSSIIPQVGQEYNFSRNQNAKTSMVLLTPSITLNYNSVVLLQGGFQKPLNNDRYATYKIKQTDIMPFLNIGVDILKAAGTANKGMSLLLSGSYARTMSVSGDPLISLSDQTVPFASTNPYPYRPDTDFSRKFDQFQAGLSFSMFQNRLMVSYNYQNIKTTDFLTTVYYFSSSSSYYENIQYDRQMHVNRFAINADVLNKGDFKWQSGLNISVYKHNSSSPVQNISAYLASLTKRDFVTGGMVNRFNYKQFSAGLDVLYCFNQERYGAAPSSIPRNNYYSINLQNVYVGYSFNALGLKNIEAYANSRNTLMTNNSTITDYRRFYGLGFKTAF